MADPATAEEQFLLRLPRELAARLSAMLAGKTPPLEISLDFDGTKGPRRGKFVLGGEEFEARLLDLPTVTESWKTYDGVNLVKSADVGQMVLVGECELPDDVVMSPHGITLATRNAATKLFRKPMEVDPKHVREAEEQLRPLVTKGLKSTLDSLTSVEYVEELVDIEPEGGGAAGAAAGGAGGQGAM